MTNKELIQALLDEAHRSEELGLANYSRSTHQGAVGFTEFGNARRWGERAMYFRQAATFLGAKL